MKMTSENQAKVAEAIEESIRQLDSVEPVVEKIIESYSNNKKVKAQLQRLLSDLADLSTEAISEQIDSISKIEVVMQECCAPHIISGDICLEHGIQQAFKSATSNNE